MPSIHFTERLLSLLHNRV